MKKSLLTLTLFSALFASAQDTSKYTWTEIKTNNTAISAPAGTNYKVSGGGFFKKASNITATNSDALWLGNSTVSSREMFTVQNI